MGGDEGGILLAENPPPRYSGQPLKSASNGVSLSRVEGGKAEILINSRLAA